MQFLTASLVTSLLATGIFAHPGEDHSVEIAERAEFTKLSKKDLSHCSEKFKARGIEKRNVARRAAAAQSARQKRGISTDAPYVRTRNLGTEHESATDYNLETSNDILFASNGSCILSPEVTQGPYWVEGEYVREDVIDGQAGVDLYLDTQIVDVVTCEPIEDAVIEIWHCNSTGVYSGVIATGNGVGPADPTNLDNTFLRGLQPTDDDGVATFKTLFPGHYIGRANHIHVMVHFNGTAFDNGTYAGGYVSHVGQIFFDQDLISAVEKEPVYNTNTQALTLNSADRYIVQEQATGHDPFVEYSLLSTTDSVVDGIFAWISFGVDLTLQEKLTGAATLTENGGVTNPNSGGGGGPNGPRPTTRPGASPAPTSGVVNGTSTATSSASSTFVAGASSSSAISSGWVFFLAFLGFL